MARPKPAVIFIFITLFLDIFGVGLIVPVLPELVQQMEGGDVSHAVHQLGWLGSIYALMQFVFSPVLGSLSDRFGRRPVILLALLGSGLDYLLLAWAPSLMWLYVGRVIAGITASNFSACSAYIADVTPPEKRAAGFGMIGAAFGLGFVAGPLVGGWLGDVGLRVPFLVAAGITLLNFLYGIFVLPESVKQENRRPFQWSSAHPIRSLLALRRWPIVVSLAETHFLIHLAQNIYPSLWVLYTGIRYGWDTKHVGASLAIVGILMAVVQGGLAGKILGVLGDRKGLAMGLLATALGMVGYGLATQGWVVYLVLVIGALGCIAGPAAQAMITREVGPEEQGAVQGALNSLTSVAGIVGPMLWTWLFAVGIGADPATMQPGLSEMVGSTVFQLAGVIGPAAFAGVTATQLGEPSLGSCPGLPFLGAAVVTLVGLVMAWRAVGQKSPMDEGWQPSPHEKTESLKRDAANVEREKISVS